VSFLSLTRTYTSSQGLHPRSYAVARFAPSCLVVGDAVFVVAFPPDHVSIRCRDDAGALRRPLCLSLAAQHLFDRSQHAPFRPPCILSLRIRILCMPSAPWGPQRGSSGRLHKTEWLAKLSTSRSKSISLALFGRNCDKTNLVTSAKRGDTPL